MKWRQARARWSVKTTAFARLELLIFGLLYVSGVPSTTTESDATRPVDVDARRVGLHIIIRRQLFIATESVPLLSWKSPFEGTERGSFPLFRSLHQFPILISNIIGIAGVYRAGGLSAPIAHVSGELMVELIVATLFIWSLGFVGSMDGDSWALVECLGHRDGFMKLGGGESIWRMDWSCNWKFEPWLTNLIAPCRFCFFFPF